jgi:hypothetical protein
MPSNTQHWHARMHGDLVQHAGDARDSSYGLVRGKPLIIPLHDAADHQNSAVDRRDELKRSVEAREAEATRLSGQRERLSGVSEAMEEFYGRRIGTQEETLASLVADLHAALTVATS